MTTEAWLPAELSDVLSASALRETPLYELLSDADVVVDRMQHEVTAEIAGPRNASLLDVPIGSAPLRVKRLAFVAGVPHHYVSILLSPNRSRVLIRESAEALTLRRWSRDHPRRAALARSPARPGTTWLK